MVPMPYQLEKGAIWSVVESAMAHDPQLLYTFIENLRNPAFDIATGAIARSKSLDDPKTNSTAASRGEHLNTDWFGMVKDKSGKWAKRPDTDFNKKTRPSTGYWINYWGDVESIVRETLLRAGEVALGLASGEIHTGGPFKRFWPVSLFLKCPTPWFEGWVTWRSWEVDPQTHARDGQVVVHFLIPGHYGSQVYLKPLEGRDVAVNPTQCVDNNGMWLITQTEHERVPDATVTVDPGTSGKIHKPSPGPVIRDHGPLLICSPAEHDGGVRPDGRAFT
jgi:hypothetical protein